MLTILAIIAILPLAFVTILTLVPVTLLRICVARSKCYKPGQVLRFPKSLPHCDRTRRAA